MKKIKIALVLFFLVVSSKALANTFTASVPPDTSTVMLTTQDIIPFTITHTGSTLPIYMVWIYFDSNEYCPSNASEAPPGWTVWFAQCQNNLSRIIYRTTTNPIQPGNSAVFNVLVQGPGYYQIPSDAQDVIDSTTQIRAYSQSGWWWIQLTYQGSQPSWIRRSLYAQAFLSPSSVGIGEDILLQLYIKNNSTQTQSLIVPTNPSPQGTGSATLSSGPFPQGVTLAPGEEYTISWTYTASGAGDLAYTTQAGNGGATSDPVTTDYIVIGDFTAQLSVEPEKIVDGWDVTVRMDVTNNGTETLGDIRPGDLIFSGTAFPTYVSGPVPESIFQLLPSASGTFEWTYTINGTEGDTFQFSGKATAQIQGISTNLAVSNTGEIVNYVVEVTPASIPSGSTNITLYFTFYNNGSSPIDLIYIVWDYPGWNYQLGSAQGDYLGCTWNIRDFNGYTRFLPPNNACRIPVGGAGKFSLFFTSGPTVSGDTLYTFNTNVRDSATRRLIVLKGKVTVTSYSLSLTKSPSGSIPADGTSYYTLTANLTNGGNPVTGAVVNFSSTAGTLSSSTAETDSNGDAVVLLYAPASSEDVSGTATASYLSANDSVNVLFTGVKEPNLQYVGGTLNPRTAEKGTNVAFTLDVYNAGTTYIALTTGSYFLISDGSTDFIAYLTAPVTVNPGQYANLTFGPEIMPSGLSNGYYYPQLYFTDGVTYQWRNVWDDVFVYSPPSITGVTRTEGTGDVNLFFSLDSGIDYEVLYKDSFTGPWNIATSFSGSTTSWVDNGSQTSSHPSTIKERYYALRISGTSIISKDWAGSFSLNVTGGMTLVSSPFVMQVTKLEDIFKDQLVGDISIINADTIWFWDPSLQAYKRAWKFDSGGAFPQWDGKWIDSDTGKETTIRILPDDGFFVQSRHGNQSVQVVGFVSTSNRQKNIALGLQMFGSTYPMGATLGASGFWESGAHGDMSIINADTIWFWDPSLQAYKRAWLFDSGGAFPQWDGKWIDSETGQESTIMLLPGYGYFYQDKVNDFTWTYPKPYTEP